MIRSAEGSRGQIDERQSSSNFTFIRRFLALAIVVIVINLCWQFFRAWMPKMLREQYQYDAKQVQYFSIGVLHRGRRRVLVDRVPHKVAGGPGPFGPRGSSDDVLCVLAPDRAERRGRRLAGLGAAAGHAAGHRIRLARAIPHLLCLHPGTFRAADGECHRAC